MRTIKFRGQKKTDGVCMGDVTKVDAVLRADTHTCLQKLQELVEESKNSNDNNKILSHG